MPSARSATEIIEGYIASIAKDRDALGVLLDIRPGQYSTGGVESAAEAAGRTPYEARKLGRELEADAALIKKAMIDIMEALERQREMFRKLLHSTVG